VLPSLILQTATRLLVTLLLVFSLFLFLRGHDEPGGGFVGGLVAAAAFALHALAYAPARTRRALGVDPRTLVAAGLLVATASGLTALALGQPLLSGAWARIAVPGLGTLDVGTPLVFDAGVYLVVLGTTLVIVLTLGEDD
jgi:multicomponent Na+:H+ antiporter subunit B